jgi:hypothetical protein
MKVRLLAAYVLSIAMPTVAKQVGAPAEPPTQATDEPKETAAPVDESDIAG